jgi:hypothetical protein
MAPGHVAADLDHQIGFFQIVIAARHHILAKRRGHGRPPKEDMQRRELVSILPEPIKPFISLLAA